VLESRILALETIPGYLHRISFSRSLKADLGTVKNLGLPDKTTAYVLAEMSLKRHWKVVWAAG